jgi:hypothetical protein
MGHGWPTFSANGPKFDAESLSGQNLDEKALGSQFSH